MAVLTREKRLNILRENPKESMMMYVLFIVTLVTLN